MVSPAQSRFPCHQLCCICRWGQLGGEESVPYCTWSFSPHRSLKYVEVVGWLTISWWHRVGSTTTVVRRLGVMTRRKAVGVALGRRCPKRGFFPVQLRKSINCCRLLPPSGTAQVSVVFSDTFFSVFTSAHLLLQNVVTCFCENRQGQEPW